MAGHSQWICAEAILNAKTRYSRDIINNHFVIFKAPPTLIAHATQKSSKFLKISLDQSNLHGNEQKKTVVCLTLQCNRGTETIYLEPSKLSLDMSNLHGRATRRVVLEPSFALHFPMDSRRSYTKRCYSQEVTNHHFVIFKAPPTLVARATRLKSLQSSIRSVQSAW